MFRLPDNSTTDDANVVVDAWKALGKWINGFDGYECDHSFDPDYAILFNGRVVGLPVDFVKAMNEKFDDLQDELTSARVALEVAIENEMGDDM